MKQLLLSVGLSLVVAFVQPAAAQYTEFDFETFYYRDSLEVSPEGFFLLLKTGEKKYGKRISIVQGALVKGHIKFDGTRYEFDEVQGYNSGSDYFALYQKQFIRRFVHGKINLYFDPGGVNAIPHYFSQVGDDGPIKQLNLLKEVRALVADCPRIEEQVPHSTGEVKKARRKKSGFMTALFEEYNKGCNP